MPTTVLTLAHTAGMSGLVSLRELITLLGPSAYGPRPLYVVGHNPNTIPDVLRALKVGANAIEPDVNVYDDRPTELCISHGRGGADAPSLVQYLDDLRAVAKQHSELALVVFDCKISDPSHGLELLNAIHAHLLPGTGLNVIVSVPDFASKGFFDQILHNRGPREGLMIDSENDPNAVASWFASADVMQRCYGNGISVLNEILGPNVRPSMEQACAARAANDQLRFIYVWTVNDELLLREYIGIGVDGIISDDLATLSHVIGEEQFRTLIRMATRADNPFMPPNAAYALTVRTGDVPMAGTDANITFALQGTQGSSWVTVETWRPGRMERGQTNFVTLQSADLGNLQSITVQRDNSGNAPDWYLDTVVVESARYRTKKQATFNRWIDSTSPFTHPL